MSIFSSVTDTKSKGKKSAEKKKGNALSLQVKLKKTVQQTIPYDTVFPNGIIETSPGNYSKSYRIADVNFKTAEQSIAEEMFLDYEGLLNALEPSMTGQVTIFNRSIDNAEVRNRVLMQPQNDSMNVYRDEWNQVLLNKMREGRNNLIREKYYTVSVEAQDITMANTLLSRLDSEVNSKVSRINKTDTLPMPLEERLGILYDIYNSDSDLTFPKKIERLVKNGKLDLAALARAGLSTKDIIGPDSFKFNSSDFRIGDVYGRVFFLDNLPTFLNAEILSDISDLPCNMITSVFYRPISSDKASTMVKHQITNINENIVRAQKAAARGNYSGDLLPSELKRAKEEAENLRSDMMSRNQKLFKVTVLMCIFCDSKEELEEKTASLQSVGVGHLCNVKLLRYQQEAALNSVLPLASLDLNIDRVLTTESASIFIPFSVQELSQDGGRYYGLNAVSHNLIMYNRLSADNYNGLIFGKPGSGKSFIAKTEIISTLLSTNDDIYVIDPEGEYAPLAEAFGGQVVDIKLGSNSHINPLDMDVQYAGESEDPTAMKCDFLTAICETIVGHGNLDPIMINLIHRCGKRIYRPYWEHMREMVKKGITCDRMAMPTLVDFYQELTQDPDQRAQMLAAALEMYCIGSYDLFAKQTNINAESRFIIYNIKDIAAGTKEMALQICLNDIWNRIIENKKHKKMTWFYIDEFHVLTQTKSSAQYMQQIYKRARKWGGIPTGITQNVEDLLTLEDSRAILNNCNFLLMMNQSQIDRAELAKMYNISESLLDYITEKPAGTGLIYNGKTIVPFINEFPTDTQLYKIMSTKATEQTESQNSSPMSS